MGDQLSNKAKALSEQGKGNISPAQASGLAGAVVGAVTGAATNLINKGDALVTSSFPVGSGEEIVQRGRAGTQAGDLRSGEELGRLALQHPDYTPQHL